MWVRPAASPYKPGEVMVIRFPNSMQRLPAEGAEVPDTDPFWRALLNVGDVVEAPAPVRRMAEQSAPQGQGPQVPRQG